MYLSQVLWSIKGPGLFNPAFYKVPAPALHTTPHDMPCSRQSLCGTLSRWIPTFLTYQCCVSKHIEFGSGSRILAQFGSGSKVMLSILKRNFFYGKTILFFKIVFINYKKILTPEELFNQWSLWIVNYCPKSYTFCLNFILLYIYMCGSGSTKLLNTYPDPDPQHCFLP